MSLNLYHILHLCTIANTFFFRDVDSVFQTVSATLKRPTLKHISFAILANQLPSPHGI